MADAIDTVRVNGNQLSWGSIYFRIAGFDVYGITELNYSIKRERQKAWGRGPRPRGRTRGKVDYENAKVKLARNTWRKLQEALADQSGSGTSYGGVEFTIFAEGYEREEFFSAHLSRCVVEKVSEADKEGPEASETELEISTMSIVENGTVIYSEDE